MYWIIHRKKQSIPPELLYEDFKKDKDDEG